MRVPPLPLPLPAHPRGAIHAPQNRASRAASLLCSPGTPPPETLAKLKKHSNSHIDFNFPHKEPASFTKLLPHISADCVEMIAKLLAYDPDDRMSARQAAKHAYFRDIREAEKRAALEKQATDDEAPAPAKGVKGGKADGSCLPSIGAQRSRSVGADIAGHGGDDADAQPQQQQQSQRACGACSSSGLPSMHAGGYCGGSSGEDMDDTGSMLPPINGSQYAALKIDSKSLLRGQKASQKPPQKLQPAPKKSGLLAAGGLQSGGLQGKVVQGLQGMQGLGAQIGSVQSRSLDKFGCQPLALGIGNSQQHGAQQMPVASGKKSYQSPYSQRFKEKSKV